MRAVDGHGLEYSWYLRKDGKVSEQDRPSNIFIHEPLGKGGKGGSRTVLPNSNIEQDSSDEGGGDDE